MSYLMTLIHGAPYGATFIIGTLFGITATILWICVFSEKYRAALATNVAMINWLEEIQVEKVEKIKQKYRKQKEDET